MIYIRTDINETIASGHLMRCLAIAEAARELGEDALFFLADENGCELLAARKFSYVVLHTPWDRMEEELPVLLPELQKRRVKKLLVDSYQVTMRYLTELETAADVYYMGDLHAFHYPVKGIICYAPYWKKLGFEKEYPETELFLGTAYTPLRPEFRKAAEDSERAVRVGRNEKKRLLLLSGGTDAMNVLGKILGGLKVSDFKQIHVICGSYNRNYELLSQQYHAYGNVAIRRDVPDLIRYMQDADIAVSAGGSTLYELCACGTPAVCYALADNQLDNVRLFSEEGLMPYAGDARTEDIVSGVNTGIAYLSSLTDSAREALEGRMRALVDGRGAERLAKILTNP